MLVVGLVYSLVAAKAARATTVHRGERLCSEPFNALLRAIDT